MKDIIFRESEEKIKSFALENGKVPLVSWKSCLINEYEYVTEIPFNTRFSVIKFLSGLLIRNHVTRRPFSSRSTKQYISFRRICLKKEFSSQRRVVCHTRFLCVVMHAREEERSNNMAPVIRDTRRSRVILPTVLLESSSRFLSALQQIRA